MQRPLDRAYPNESPHREPTHRTTRSLLRFVPEQPKDGVLDAKTPLDRIYGWITDSKGPLTVRDTWYRGYAYRSMCRSDERQQFNHGARMEVLR